MVAEHFGSNLPSIIELEQRTSLAFVNTNPAMDYLSPLPENCIAVGGLHINEPKPLPQVIDYSYGCYLIRSDYIFKNHFLEFKRIHRFIEKGCHCRFIWIELSKRLHATDKAKHFATNVPRTTRLSLSMEI